MNFIHVHPRSSVAILRFCLLWLLSLLPPAVLAAEPAARQLYQQHCAECHGDNRLGGMGPALLPDVMRRLEPEQAVGVIAQGRPATQMPAYGDKLSTTDIQVLVDHIFTPPATTPAWAEPDIEATHRLRVQRDALPAGPVHEADPLNMFVVVELGDHHASILDGDSFEVLKRVPTRYALHGGPKYSPDGRFVYFASRNGWIAKFDMYSLQYVAEVRAGINTRNLAVSGDGRYVMVANYLPNTLVLLDARDLRLLRVFEVADDHGNGSRVSAVYDAPPRQSFIAALKDIPEVWEIRYADNPLPVYKGLMHDYRMEEGAVDRGPFPVRRIRLDDYLDDFFFDQSYTHLIGAARNASNGQVVHLDVGRKIAELELDGLPHLGSGITWEYEGRPVLATPHLKKGEVSVIDMQNWKTIKRIRTDGPGFFMRSHENTPYAWVDAFFGPNRDKVHIIDKRTLEIVKTLQPVPGKTAAHVEFDRSGEHALLSIWDMDGAVIVYDAETFEEVKRLPMVKPSGKYNVHNKISRSAGTSH
ncbi:cytochrome c [Thiohalobacter sp. COW1]|uniref:nitrite reductase n=1 Tax=Thiohalobacter sp. COW1 TaxID=2795687 RepID=UPI00191617AE|nr:nitrite reductase [Thiohalobacter sp. COW1]BCO32167.1 cytochrome c [Thiohalobacter sp. COW1]